MRRLPVPLVVSVALVLASLAFGQAPPPGGQPVRPRPPTPGAQVPGITPPRDNGRPSQPPTGTARLRGRIVAGLTGLPLRRAQITATATDGVQLRRTTTTDGEGRYEFLDLPAGRFSLSAVKAGYVTLQYGQRRPYEAGTPVNVADGEAIDRLDFSLPKGSVIAVRLIDEFGEPIAGAQVQVQRFQYGPDGQRRLTSAQTGIFGLSGTDDRGEFRAYGLMPGEYVILGTSRSVLAPGGGSASDSNEGFAATYYPGTMSSAEAQAVTVNVGEEVSVEFSLAASRLGRISGTVVDAEGKPAVGAQLSVVTVTGSGMTSYGAGQSAADGSFILSGIAPGEHTIRVTHPRPGAVSEFASVPVVVGGADVAGLQITMGAGATVTGRVTFEGSSPRTTTTGPLRILASQADPQRQLAFLGGGQTAPDNGMIADDGSFSLAGVSGKVFFTVTPPPGWGVKSVMFDGDDITDVPLDLTGRATVPDVRVTLTDKLTNVAGQVLDARGNILKDYVVVIQAAEQKEPIVASRSIRLVRPDTNGRFQARGIRPGRYVATALESLEQGRQYSPEFQKELRLGAREFTLREGDTVAVDLRLTQGL